MLQPKAMEVVMLASDVCSFTSLSEGAPLEGVWHVCTTFIDICTTAIMRHGGEVARPLYASCIAPGSVHLLGLLPSLVVVAWWGGDFSDS